MRSPDLKMVMTHEAAADWNMLLRSGVLVPVTGPVKISRLLENDLGMDAEYVESRVATIFLNGKPVDDLDAAVAAPGSTVALAGFMPGIAGITMRRNSPVAAMRCQITSKECDETPAGPGHVTVRLFSTVAVEAGPGVMRRGFELCRDELAEFLKSRDKAFWHGLVSAELNGEPADSARLGRASAEDFSEPARVLVERD